MGPHSTARGRPAVTGSRGGRRACGRALSRASHGGVAHDRLDLDAMADVLAEWIATGSAVTNEDKERTLEALAAIGVPEILESLAMAERIISFGNSFHYVPAFFADWSPEQKYLLWLTDPKRKR
jgi:hypothetical protein